MFPSWIETLRILEYLVSRERASFLLLYGKKRSRRFCEFCNMPDPSAFLALADAAMQGTLATLSSNAQRKQQAMRFLFPLGSAGILALIYSYRKQKPRIKNESIKVDDSKGYSTKKVAVNKVFYKNLKVLLKICIPHWRSKTSLLLVTHSAFLILRTYLSLVVAQIDGRIVKGKRTSCF
jgi:hypothetical protein